jgi:hypothetical protein
VTATVALLTLTATTLPRAAVGTSMVDALFDSPSHPAIAYATTPPSDPVAELGRRLQDGLATLAYTDGQGYLPALLQSLHVPIASQLVVFSKTSLQAALISPQNPRAIFFNDTVAVAWPRGGFIEIASRDARQGTMFYVLSQQRAERPQFIRSGTCLGCHVGYATLNIPGTLARSVVTAPDGRTLPFLGNYTTDDRSPLDERWAGWYVTGHSGAAPHLGNERTIPAGADQLIAAHPSATTSLAPFFDVGAYPAASSDITALLVFDHQMRMNNLLTGVGWRVRIAAADAPASVADVAREAGSELADALLFVEEAPLAGPVAGASAFAAEFEARGPFDSKGRSLRHFDLRTRLMRYPCSYAIYSDAFDQLPAAAKEAVYTRMWTILSGADAAPRYRRLSADDRRAIVEILRDTKRDLPAVFREATS